MIKQFLTDVVWGDVDFLIIDTPPGRCCVGQVGGDEKSRRSWSLREWTCGVVGMSLLYPND